MAEEAAKILFRAIAGNGDAGGVDPSGAAEPQQVLDVLKALSRALYARFEAADNAGDNDLADRLDALLTRITILRISVGQAVQRYIDDAPDIAEATAAIDRVNAKLKAAAEGTEKQAGDLKQATAAIDQLARLIGWAEKTAGG